MATSYNPFTGDFQDGDAQAAGTWAANPLTPQPQEQHNYRGSGGWVGGAEGVTERDAGGNGWVSTADLARGTGAERTVRNSYGHPVTNRPYRGTDRMDIPGMKGVTLDLAAQLGYVTRNPDGTFSFSGEAGSDRGAPQQPQAQRHAGQPEQAPEQQPEGQPIFRASDEAENAVTALTRTFDMGTQMFALNSIVENGSLDDATIERLAQRSGKEPQQIAEQVNAAHQGFYDAVTTRMESQGVHDLDLFGDYVEGDFQRERQMQKAVRDLMMTNDASGFDRLAAEFVHPRGEPAEWAGNHLHG